MGKKTIVAIATVAGAGVIALAAAALWLWPGLGAPGTSVGGTSMAGSDGALRKCRRGAQIEYTNGLCPPGTREEAVRGGSLSVLPAPPAPAAAVTAASAQPLLRGLARDVDGREMQDKRIERVIGR